MKLQDACEQYAYFSGEASKLTRQLALAAIAVIWVFRVESPGGAQVPQSFLPVAALAVMALTLDFSQYAYGAALWGWFHRHKERELGRGSEEDFGIEPAANWPTIVCFWLKSACIAAAYAVLLVHLLPTIWR